MNRNHDSKGRFASGKGGGKNAGRVVFGKSTASNETKALGRLQGSVARKNMRDFNKTGSTGAFKSGYAAAGGSLFRAKKK